MAKKKEEPKVEKKFPDKEASRLRKKEARAKFHTDLAKLSEEERKQRLTDIVDNLLEQAEEASDEWHRYIEEGIKAGAKKARKVLLLVKKGTAEFRKIIKTIDLKGKQ